MRGLTLFRLGKPADAIPLLEAAHNWTSQTKVDPSYVLGISAISTRGYYDNARRPSPSSMAFPPDSAPAYLLAARMLLRREYLPVAQQFASKALELDPQLPLAHALLGEIALAGGHLDEAIAEFEKERLRNPLDGGIYDRLGDAYTRAGDYTRRHNSPCSGPCCLSRTRPDHIFCWAKYCSSSRIPASAMMYLERAEKMDPSNYMTHNLLGQALSNAGQNRGRQPRDTDSAEDPSSKRTQT